MLLLCVEFCLLCVRMMYKQDCRFTIKEFIFFFHLGVIDVYTVVIKKSNTNIMSRISLENCHCVTSHFMLDDFVQINFNSKNKYHVCISDKKNASKKNRQSIMIAMSMQPKHEYD